MNSEQLAWKIRRHGVEMTHLSGGSHLGAILSVADIMAVLYTDVLRVDPKNPDDENRDRFILSKGHAGAAVYAALAESGFFDVAELVTHYQNGSRLSGHVSHYVPGVDLSTGSLGHGLSVGVGMAYAGLKSHKDYNVYVVLGDGECDEGSVWEAALFANHFDVKNITAIVDHNKMQSMDFCDKTLDLGDFEAKWESFGWNVVSIDGNNHDEIKSAFAKQFDNKKPKVIIANTVKGYGIPFMENDILWHYRFPHDGWEYDLAVNELHKIKPEGAEDIYTPNGVENPTPVPDDADICNDHTTTATWHPTWQKEGK